MKETFIIALIAILFSFSFSATAQGIQENTFSFSEIFPQSEEKFAELCIFSYVSGHLLFEREVSLETHKKNLHMCNLEEGVIIFIDSEDNLMEIRCESGEIFYFITREEAKRRKFKVFSSTSVPVEEKKGGN